MASRGIIEGASETTFKPFAGITRADFVKLLVAALGLTAQADDNFADVSPDAYYAKAVGIAKKLGIVSGDGKGKFNPNAQITRQELMTIVARALKVARPDIRIAAGNELEKFQDAGNVAAYAKDAAAMLVKEGIVSGKSGRISPLQNTTRAEAATILYRLFIYCLRQADG
jgi:hypothetical protein